jgi:hypothetical protein
LLALQGVLGSIPALLAGSVVVRLVAPAGAPGVDLAGVKRPIAYVFEPLVWAHEHDADGVVVLWLVVQALALWLLWGLFGGAISRLAAVGLARERPEEGGAAMAFARRHWRSVVGARLAFWGGAVGAVLLAAGLASAGRLPGAIGSVLLAAAVFAAFALCLGGTILASVHVAAGFLVGPTVACEDSDAFDAVSRTFTYAASGLPRVVVVRLLFLAGVVIGSGWRLVRTLAAGGLAYAALRAGAGDAALQRAAAVLGASGSPADADRLGVGLGDQLVAGAIALAAGGLAALWLADLISRVLCARVGAYLVLRQEIDGVPTNALRTAPRATGHLTAEEAGFVEVTRIP